MKTVFPDTFYYLARLGRNDADRARVIELSRHISAHVLTTAWILTEVADAMSSTLHRPLFLRLLKILRSDPSVRILPATEDLFQRGLSLYAERPDQGIIRGGNNTGSRE